MKSITCYYVLYYTLHGYKFIDILIYMCVRVLYHYDVFRNMFNLSDELRAFVRQKNKIIYLIDLSHFEHYKR